MDAYEIAPQTVLADMGVLEGDFLLLGGADLDVASGVRLLVAQSKLLLLVHYGGVIQGSGEGDRRRGLELVVLIIGQSVAGD